MHCANAESSGRPVQRFDEQCRVSADFQSALASRQYSVGASVSSETFPGPGAGTFIGHPHLISVSVNTLPALLPGRADPVCHPHAGLVCLGGCVKRPPGPFFISRAVRCAHCPPSQPSMTARASSSPVRACAENNCAVTAVSLQAACVSLSTRSESRRFSLSDFVSSTCACRLAREHPLEHGGVLSAEPAAAVDDEHQSDQRLAHVEVMLHQLEPARAHLLRHLGESVPGQIDEPALIRRARKN